jgi:hypothetical protein
MVQGDQTVSVHLMIIFKNTKNLVYSNNPHTINDLKMAITEYIRNVDCAILNMSSRTQLISWTNGVRNEVL